MPLNINEFKSSFSESLPITHYEMIVNPPGNAGGGQEINLRTESIMLPGVSFFSVDNYSAYGNGLMYNIPYRYSPQEISVVHTIDEDANMISIFRDWTNKIIDLNGDDKFGAKYFKDYVVEGQIIVFNRQLQSATKKIKLFDLYPISVEPINMSWGQNDDIAKLAVSYRFTRYEMN
jgi:hypothetical protein